MREPSFILIGTTRRGVLQYHHDETIKQCSIESISTSTSANYIYYTARTFRVGWGGSSSAATVVATTPSTRRSIVLIRVTNSVNAVLNFMVWNEGRNKKERANCICYDDTELGRICWLFLLMFYLSVFFFSFFEKKKDLRILTQKIFCFPQHSTMSLHVEYIVRTSCGNCNLAHAK